MSPAASTTYTLTATGPGGSVTAPVTVTVVPAPVASFSANPTSGPTPLTVAFTDASTGSITAWTWDFGDGGTSTAESPSHTYAAPGIYPVRLTVSGPGGSHSETKTSYITVTTPAPDPDGDGTGATWRDYRVGRWIRSDDDDAIGVMFRYQDNDNYYRFSWDAERTYRRLVKREGGVVTLLAEDAVPYVPGQTYQLEIIAQGPTLEVSIDGTQIFSVTDTSFASGTIALYSWGNQGTYFDDVLVEDLAAGTVLLADDFNDGDLTGWTVIDEGTISAPPAWSAATGSLVQSADISSADGADLLGTFALYTAR